MIASTASGITETVLSGPLLLAMVVAAAAGLVSFASPCVLPLVPGFLGYVTGMAPETADRGGRWRLVAGALLFVLGFSAVFIAMSVVVSSLAATLVRHQDLLLRVGGVVVLGLGLFLLLGRNASWQTRWRPRAGLAGAPLLGVAFGIGFSACSGPALVAIQALSSSLVPDDRMVARAVTLAVAYCLGLGLPFLLLAAGMGWVSAASRRLRQHHDLIQRVGAICLLLLGLLMVSGLWNDVTTWIQTRLTSTFQTVL